VGRAGGPRAGAGDDTIGVKGKGRGQQRYGQHATHLRWPMRPPRAPPHRIFPERTCALRTHTDAFAARQRHPPLPRLKMPASFNATR
jgi:hypothetical protein